MKTLAKFLISAFAVNLLLIANANAAVLPNGTYQATCHGCYMEGDMLFCVCKSEQGLDTNTSYNMQSGCANVVNANGFLECKTPRSLQPSEPPQPAYHQLPAGNYLNSCHTCRFKKHYLFCQCRNLLGGWSETSTYVPNHCRFIENYHGQLACVNTHHYKHFRNAMWASAGPLWNDREAQQKCPGVCSINLREWSGKWHMVTHGRNGVCECVT